MNNHDLRVYRRKLPHFRLDGATYFVTWRTKRGPPDLAPAERTRVAETVRYFDLNRYELIAWVVMNDHVHVVLTPLGGTQLEQIMHSWRSYTTNAFKRRGRSGSVWQAEYMDRIIRNGAELRQTVEYIVDNPQKRWPGIRNYPWVWANWMDDEDERE